MRENRIVELAPLIEARGKVVRELLAAEQSIGADDLLRLREIEDRLMAGLQAKRNATLERLNSLSKAKRARRTYSKAA